MREFGMDKIVFSSSCATYGHPVTVPIPDDHPQSPASPYGATKLMCEQILADFAGAYGLHSVALRYFNAAGADPDNEIGEAHEPETHLIPNAVLAALGQQDSFTIYGTDFPTEDGTAVRDFAHVTDLADAHIRALKYLDGGGETTAMNLGTGRGHSVREIVRCVEAATGAKIPVRCAPRRAGDPAMLIADSRRSHEILDWQPRHSEIGAVVATAVSWQRKMGGARQQPDRRLASG